MKEDMQNVRGGRKLQEAFDLGYNIAAMYIAILREDVATPEQAFAMIGEIDTRLTEEDTEDMIKMKEQGMYYRQIGEIYGLSDSGVSRRIKKYEKRISQTAI